jgi:rhodanese-related sulfurtransferase
MMPAYPSEISVDELAHLLEGGIHLIDVRQLDEYQSGHVAGAVHITLQEIPNRVEECVSADGSPTYLICKVGGRSAQACEYLAGQSLNVVNIAGGTLAWLDSGRDVVEGDNPT